MILALCLLALQTAAAAPPPEAPLTLREALVWAEEFSPDLKAAQAREFQAANAVAISKSYLYPDLQGQAGVGYGFLGGANSLLGLQQLAPSPESHIGPIGGIYGSLAVFNASAYLTIALAKKDFTYFQALTALTRYQVDLAAARAYFEAARARGGAAAWNAVGREMQALLSDVESLIHSGYQNPVDALLVKDQVSQARIEAQAFAARYRAALKGLGALLGTDDAALSCPLPAGLSEAAVDVFEPGISPYLQIGQSQVKVAEATVSQKKSANYPVVNAMGAVDTGLSATGYVSPNRDYSLGLGISLPLFQGYRIAEQTKQARNLLKQRQFDLGAADVQVSAQSAELDSSIDSARAALSGLAPEYEDDQKALRLARQRYRDFQGPLVDVREALRDLARISVAQNDAMAELLFALTGKSLLNGGTVRR